jgi:hypothetical protein
MSKSEARPLRLRVWASFSDCSREATNFAASADCCSAPREVDIGLRDRAAQRHSRGGDVKRARVGLVALGVDQRLLLARQVERPAQVRLDRPEPPPASCIGRGEDVVLAQPLIRLLRVGADVGQQSGVRVVDPRLHQAQPRHRGFQRRAARERVGHDPVELRIAQRVPPFARERDRRGRIGKPDIGRLRGGVLGLDVRD